MAAPGEQKREYQEINLNINPSASFPIHKRCGSTQAKFIVSKFSNQLWKHISKCSNTPLPLGMQPNLLLRTKRDELPVHNVILSAFSDNIGTWSTMCIAGGGMTGGPSKYPFELNLAEKSPNITPEALRRVVQFLYIGKLKFSMSDLPEILEVANFFGVTELKNRTGDHVVRLAKSERTTLPNCLQMSFTYEFPSSFRDTLVTLMADQFTTFLRINNGQYLYALSGDVIEAVLSSNELNAPAPIEMSVFSFALNWLRNNRRDSPKFANVLMEVCRFDKMSTQEKYQCLDDARHAGFDHLIRSKIMTADWQYTCQRWNQMDKCDPPTSKRKNATSLPKDPRGPSGGFQSQKQPATQTDNAIEERYANKEEMPNKESLPSRDYKPQQNDDVIVTEENLDLEARRQKRLEKRSARRKEKKGRRSSSGESTPEMSENDSISQKSRLSEKPMISDDEEMNTAELPLPLSSSLTPSVASSAIRSPMTSEKERDVRRLTEDFDRQQKIDAESDRAKELREAVTVFTSLLNKQGRRLLVDRMMEPDFGAEFNKILMCDNKGSKLKSPMKSNVIIGHEFDEQNLPEKNFVYSPESSDYKSYLDTMRNVESDVEVKVAPHAAAVRNKTINGGVPLTLRQSVIHSKIDEKGRLKKIAYEKKHFSETLQPSADSNLNQISSS